MQEPRIYREVARLHARNLDKSFLATLGEGFLTEMYRAIDRCPSSTLLVEKHEGAVVGFVTGASGMGPIYRQMLSRWWILPFRLFPRLLHPRTIGRVVDILRYSAAAPLAPESPKDELLSIAVDPNWRGRGYSEALYTRLCEHFRDKGSAGFKIVVGAPLAAAHRFYQKMGAEAVGEIEVHAGERSVLYVQRLRRHAN